MKKHMLTVNKLVPGDMFITPEFCDDGSCSLEIDVIVAISAPDDTKHVGFTVARCRNCQCTLRSFCFHALSSIYVYR